MNMHGLLKKICLPLLALTLVTLGDGTPTVAAQASSNFMIGTDMMMPDLYLINTENDARVKVDLSKDPKYPGGAPLHTIIMPDGRKAYLTVMSSDKDPLTILVLRIGKIDCKAGTADVKMTNVMRLGEPGAPPSMLVPTQTDPSQPVTAL